MENTNQVIPPDLAGFQHIVCGLIEEGDVLVFGNSREKVFARALAGTSVADSDFDVYRKMECPKHEGQLKHPKDMSWEDFAGPIQWHNIKDEDQKAKTNDGGKPPLANLPWKALREVAGVQLFGHSKYGDFHNYKKGMEISRQLSCAIRHIADFMDGIDLDSESGKNHLAHAACRILFTLETVIEKTAKDDRYKSK